MVFYKILMDNVKGKAWTMVSGEIDFVEQNQAQNNDFSKQKIKITTADIKHVQHQISDTYQKIMAHEFSEISIDDESFPMDERFGTSVLIAMRPWGVKVFESLRRSKAKKF